ncbi:hypothetical protein MFMK1_002267 [Metallumcola ferriviriculae]|uniref:Uncharacterized protein n=1 Tax=Metallumcola ferriviriculae TaxID=3039180 RepID=A0AAU0UT48_9FIRM|nr:hypothetical protein MFMK1_002267 [Desulfitibacteraceae bacterium MK1]
MTLFLILVAGALLAVTFGFSSGLYLSRYVMGWTEGALSIASTFVFGTAISVVTFAVALVVVWPPFLPM